MLEGRKSSFINIYFCTGKFTDADSTEPIDRDIKFCLASDSKRKLWNFLLPFLAEKQKKFPKYKLDQASLLLEHTQ